MKDIKIVKSHAEVNTYYNKFSEVFCDKELCGYIVKINDNRYNTVTSDGEQWKLCDDMDSAIKGLIIQHLKKAGAIGAHVSDPAITEEDKEKLSSALKELFESLFGECDCPECTEKREQENKQHHPIH
ncbi:hypothetical protein C2433_10730 [Salmonella enterica]|nr:hypothetical protein [Salmonella enterica]EDO6281717.1 hypothetical protein [Salmonella enterica]EJQ9249251.1 hypothetical protein [Salmonella enterica]